MPVKENLYQNLHVIELAGFFKLATRSYHSIDEPEIFNILTI